ncbi:MAG: molybdopterin-dependent oxidoreductase [Treponema sp.]|nr:molybdopterin-dependent oxidoreductase [Treponema sp.]
MFVEDIITEQMFFAVLIRSPVASAFLKAIEHPRMPNLYTLIQANDIPGINHMEDCGGMPLLSPYKLAYIGEPLAILVGPDLDQVEQYALRCVVHSEPNTEYTDPPPFDQFSYQEKEIVVADDATVVNGTYHTAIQEHWYAEPHGAVAEWVNGTLLIRTATQWPAYVRKAVSRTVGISEESIIVEPLNLGMPLDGKLYYDIPISCSAALAAYLTKGTVKLLLNREEDFLFSPKRHATTFHIQSFLDKDTGALLKTTVDAAMHLGAYGAYTKEIIAQTWIGSTGLYSIEPLQFLCHATQSPIPPQGPYIGFGTSQAFFALERHVSRIADVLGQDPAEWRKNNLLPSGKKLPNGLAVPEDTVRTLIDSVIALSDYSRKWVSYSMFRGDIKQKPNRGIGISLAYQLSGFLSEQQSYAVEVTLEKDGSLTIKTSGFNEYVNALWKERAAHILALEPHDVHIHHTSLFDSGPATLSRTTAIITPLIEHACLKIQKQHFREPLPITVRCSINPEQGVWNGMVIDKHAYDSIAVGVAVVEIELDPILSTPTVLGIYMCIDGGQILSDIQAIKTVKAYALHALSWASSEELSYQEGKIPDSSFYRYKIPTISKAPAITVNFLNRDQKPKGIGQLAFSTIPAAYIQAISQALDYPFERIPLTGQDISSFYIQRMETV